MANPQRTYGRTAPDPITGKQEWVVITPDPQTGLLDLIYFATLCQTLRLSRGESPVYSNYGIAAQQAVLTQIPPDFDLARTQSQFSQYFSSLVISKAPPPTPPLKRPIPTYNVSALTHAGLQLNAAVPLAT